VNFAALRSVQSLLSIAFVASAAVFLASCGGGGASGSPATAESPISITPSAGSLYAGVPYTVNIVGGRRPYLITSNEQTLVALGYSTTSSSFEFVANNPGVVDVGQDPDQVPSRTLIITVTDSSGAATTGTYNVLQNFFTGYGVSYQSICASGTGNAPQACSGLDSVIRFSPTSQGTRYGNRVLQFDKIRGDFQFVQEDPAVVPQLVNQLRATTDQTGLVLARIRVTVAAPTQIATYRITDVRTGVTTDQTFLIVQQDPTTTINLVPNTFTFTGGLAGTCGTGTGQAIVLGGVGPYQVLTSTPFIIAGPNPIARNGDLVSVTVPVGVTGTQCPNGTVTIIDSQGARGTITVTSQPGTGTLPPIAVSPTTLTLTCVAPTGSAAVIGGNGPLSAVTSHPRVQATISGNVLTVTRLVPDLPVTPYPTTATVAITDGATIVNLTATVPASCP